MFNIAREVARVRYPVFAVSVVAWAVLLARPFGMNSHCLNMEESPRAIAGAWVLMLVAMMAPLTVPALHHIRLTSLARRRGRAIAAFLSGYGAVWMGCGLLFEAIERATISVSPRSYVPATVAAFAALAWQASPFKQICLNRCHRNRPIAVFGLEADLDAFCFGVTLGAWCVGGCWALMLLPILLPQGHMAAMAASAVLIFCERLEDPGPPRWQLRGLGRASRIVIARTRMRLQMLASARVSGARSSQPSSGY
jgi:predicted metal-binding membrane protein